MLKTRKMNEFACSDHPVPHVEKNAVLESWLVGFYFKVNKGSVLR